MKRILSSLLVALTLLVVGGVFTTSCSNEIISTQRVDNTPHAFTIKLSAGFELPEIKELDSIPGTRATTETVNLIFQIQDSRNKKVTVDRGGNSSTPAKFAHLNRTLVVERYPTMKFLTVVRAKNRKDVVYYDYSEWKYDEATNCWIKEAISIPLSAGFKLNDEIEVRLAAGGEITVADDQMSADIKVTPTIHQEVHFNTAEAQKMELPIPYISDWHDLTYDENTTAMILASGRTNSIPVKPQGILMLASVRNNMSIPVTLGGIRFKSNALEYGGTFNLAGDNVQFTESNENLQVVTARATKDVYKNVKITFHQPLHLRAKMGTESDMALILTWAYPHTEKFVGESWRHVPKNSPNSNLGKQLFGQIHIYAVDVFNSAKNEVVTRPNYEVVPIMGTSNILKQGYSYTFNCELYDQPNLLLGYFAKYTVNQSGTGFDASHNVDDVSLVNWRIAKEFLGQGKELTNSDGVKAKFKMIPFSAANNVLASGPGFFQHGWYQASGMQAPYDGRIFPAVPRGGETTQMQFNYNGYSGDAMTIQQAYTNNTGTRAYSITNRWTPKTSSIYRDLPQIVTRYEIGEKTNLSNVTYTSYSKVSSLYLGKYFVGGLFTPILGDLSLVDEELWLSDIGRGNIVERVFPVPGYYKDVSANDVDNIAPAITEKKDKGIRTNYWCVGKGWFTNRIMGELAAKQSPENLSRTAQQWIDLILSDGNPAYKHYLMTPYWGGQSPGGMATQENMRSMLFQPLITYSNVYQGDSAD